MASVEDQNMVTTFLLLIPLTSERPPIRNTELPAGDAFNSALRLMASREGFQMQWFGWQHAAEGQENMGSSKRFVWVVNWRGEDSAGALTSPKVLQEVFGKLSQFFQIPETTSSDSIDLAEDKVSKVMNVRWTSGNSLKLLNWTNRILVLGVMGADSHAQDEWTARGQVISSHAQENTQKSTIVEMRSIQLQSPDEEPPFIDRPYVMPESFNNSIAVSLTRTRWCTQIREGLMETIKARRVD